MRGIVASLKNRDAKVISTDINFDNQLDEGKVTEFAVSEEAFSEGKILAKDLLQSKFGARLQNKEQLIAMFMKLVEEGETDG